MQPELPLKFELFKWPFASTRNIHAPLMAVTALYRQFPQVHAAHFAQRFVYMLKFLFDSDTNKCFKFNKDITEYLDKYHNKSINKYKASSSTSTKTSASTSSKPSTSRSTSFNPYTSMPSSYCPSTAFAPLPRLPHTAATRANAFAPPPRRGAAPMPPCTLHAAPTPPPRRSTAPQRCCNAVPTQS